MNKLLTITAAAIAALSAGAAFAQPVQPAKLTPISVKQFCARWEAYLDRFGETAYFEKNIEKTYTRLCKEHEGHEGGDDRRDEGGRDK